MPQATAQVLRGAHLRSRHGGDEFFAILPSTEPAQVMEVAGRIRERTAGLAIAIHGATATITASLDIATFEHDESAAALIDRADAALCRAKTQGRNRCVFAAPIVVVNANPPLVAGI